MDAPFKGEGNILSLQAKRSWKAIGADPSPAAQDDRARGVTGLKSCLEQNAKIPPIVGMTKHEEDDQARPVLKAISG